MSSCRKRYGYDDFYLLLARPSLLRYNDPKGGMSVDIINELFSMQDIVYRDFQRKTIPGIDPETIIGVRTPQLRAMAKAMSGTQEAEAFLSSLPHDTFEENQLHAFLINEIRAFEPCLAAVDSFLPHVDNWATCDQLSPKALGKDLLRLKEAALGWLASDGTYTIRFGINTLMRWFLAEGFELDQLERVAALRSQEYYVRMGAAWYFAEAMVDHPEAVIACLKERRLPEWTHNKAIQKMTESRRIPPEMKAYLRTLKIR